MQFVPSGKQFDDHYDGIKSACKLVDCYQKLEPIGEGTYGVVFKYSFFLFRFLSFFLFFSLFFMLSNVIIFFVKIMSLIAL